VKCSAALSIDEVIDDVKTTSLGATLASTGQQPSTLDRTRRKKETPILRSRRILLRPRFYGVPMSLPELSSVCSSVLLAAPKIDKIAFLMRSTE
jgi:hypothetical protein